MSQFRFYLLSAGMACASVLPGSAPLCAEETADVGAPEVKPAPAPEAGNQAEDWQAKLDAQMTKSAAPAPATPEKPEAPSELDKATKKLVSDIQKAEQGVALAKAPKTDKADKTEKADSADKITKDWFKVQWALLKLVPEAAYKTAETRKRMAAENEENKTFLKDNEGNLKTLSELFVRFKQKLGLRSDRVEQIAKRMNVKGPVDETKGASASASSGDISLGEPDPKAAKVDMAASVTPTEKYRIQMLEQYLKRLAAEETAKDMANAEKDFKEAAKVLDGAYFFQVLYKQTPALATQYPETFKFLRGLNGGLGDLRAYEDLLAQTGMSVDENGDLVRTGPNGETVPVGAPADGAAGPGPGPGGWTGPRGGGGGPRGGPGGGPGGGGRGGRGN